ncbi:MAG: hypothetical protein WEA56_04715 [Balneolaceae bacterium]
MAMNICHSNGIKTQSRFTIRPFTENDIGQVANLFFHHFPEYIHSDMHQLESKLASGLSCSNRPLVCSSSNGTIQGYLSVKLLDFIFKGKPVTGAIFSDFMANEKARNALVPMRMLQTALKGPQDFSFSDDAVYASCLMWCRLGGQIAYPYSFYYTMILRPVSFSLQMVEKKFTTGVKLFSGNTSRRARTMWQSLRNAFSHPSGSNRLSADKLSGKILEEKLTSLMSGYELYPSVDGGALNRLIDSLKNEKQFGDLQAAALSDSQNKMRGWFIYYLNRTGRCNVIHAECLPGHEEKLYDSLKEHSFSRGGVNVAGRLSPWQMGSSFSEKTINRPGEKWSLIHSKNQELLQTVQSGKAFLTRCW